MSQIFYACRLPPRSLVVDPFAGSGTTLAVARALGLRAIGIEDHEPWCAVIARRMTENDIYAELNRHEPVSDQPELFGEVA